MKITITYKDSEQISPDDFRSFTRVIHLQESDNLETVFNKITADWVRKISFDAEIHFIKE